VASTAIIMVEETWVMAVGVPVVVDKNVGCVLVKVEVCDRKRRGKCHEKRYRIKREGRGRRRWMEMIDVLPTS